MKDPSVMNDLAKDAEIILYCNSGNRSEIAKQIFQQNGFNNSVNGINMQHVTKNYIN